MQESVNLLPKYFRHRPKKGDRTKFLYKDNKKTIWKKRSYESICRAFSQPLILLLLPIFLYKCCCNTYVEYLPSRYVRKIHWDFLVYWISTIFQPIFRIFQCIPAVFTLVYAVKPILHTFTYHTEHVTTLDKHLIMFYFVWAAIVILIYPTWLRCWGYGSLVESKWCRYVIFEADSHLKLLPASSLDM